MATKSSPKKKPVPVGRRWTQLNDRAFIRKFPQLGKKRLEIKEAKKKKRLGKRYKPGPARIYRYPDRAPPSRRKGAKFVNVTIPLDTSLRLKELSKFYKKSMSFLVTKYVNDAFDEAYREAELLARINQREARDQA